MGLLESTNENTFLSIHTMSRCVALKVDASQSGVIADLLERADYVSVSIGPFRYLDKPIDASAFVSEHSGNYLVVSEGSLNIVSSVIFEKDRRSLAHLEREFLSSREYSPSVRAIKFSKESIMVLKHKLGDRMDVVNNSNPLRARIYLDGLYRSFSAIYTQVTEGDYVVVSPCGSIYVCSEADFLTYYLPRANA